VAVIALQNRHDLRPEHVNAITSRLGDEASDVREAAVQALQNRHDLRPEHVNAIAGRLGDEYSIVRLVAVIALQNRHDLRPEHVNAITSRLEDEHSFVRQAAVRALLNRQDFSLETVDQFMESLYQTLMEESFFRHLYCHVTDETTYLVFDVQEVPFKGQQDLFQNTLQKVHRRLNIPVPVAAQRLNAEFDIIVDDY